MGLYWNVCSAEWLINRFRWIKWRLWERQKKLPAWRDWLEVILAMLFVIILINQYLAQLFIIPSGSMIPTLEVGDRVFVNKIAYGLELYPYGEKYLSNRKVERGTVIPFVSPEYRQRGIRFTILQRFVLLMSFTTIDLEIISQNRSPQPPKKLASQPVQITPRTARLTGYRTSPKDSFQPPLLVKRAIGVEGDTVRESGGNLEIRLAGQARFISESRLKELAGLSYPAIRSNNFESPKNETSFEGRTRLSYLINPHDPELRSRYLKRRLGSAVPTGHVLPFGDNRDQSHDSRWFGLVSCSQLQGEVLYILYPFSRVRKLDP